ncbi:MAG: hypothetical protein D4R68_07115 [Ignavibacteriales bacterium]|nr:MAG: hypothetical protein D4R68_07115 [Ignavibacteriales bacterium]
MNNPVISKSNLFDFFQKSDCYAKYFFAIIFLSLLSFPILKAQDLTKNSNKLLIPSTSVFSNSLSRGESLAFANSVFPDTTVQIFKPKLLPDKMSFFERGLWGENGLMRGIGLASPLTPEVRKYELEVRRTMLTAHQIGGFATLGLMLATCYYGQKIIDGDFNYESTKKKLVFATITSYSITALLSILSPPPLIRRDETSTTTIHKFLAWFHVAGMIVTPILGSLINTNRVFNIDKAHFHQVAGYITTAIFATAMIVITF